MSQPPMGIALPRLTPTVKVLLIANAALYVLLGLIGRFYPEAGETILDNLALSVNAILSFRLWTLLSYSLLHSLADFFHLFFNMLLLYFFGPTLEGRWGSRRFVIFYFLGALGGGLTFFAFNLALGSSARLVGASGAVLALIIAWGILFPNLPVYLFGVLPIRGKHLILLTVGIELLLAVSQTPVSSAAHFGGMATGALLITGYWRPSKVWGRLRPRLRVPRARRGRRRTPKFTVVINPDDDDKAPPGGWVH